jgi:hypothetical protein
MFKHLEEITPASAQSISTDGLDAHPKKGERWDSLDGTRTCRVMSDPIEGYVMARWKGAMPWLLHVNDWPKRLKRHGG